MPVTKFPEVTKANPQGLLAIGGDLEVDSLILAYRSGIFPWPYDDSEIYWHAPHQRAVLFFDSFHVSASLKKERRKNWASFAFNKNFTEVITECQKLTNRKNQSGTWITNTMRAAYINLHKAGFAHSIECYQGKQLVGGLYGVSIGNMFAAESMFFRTPNASKLALWQLIDYLSLFGVKWLDIQVMTPHLEKFGAKEIRQAEFMKLLEVGVKQNSHLFSEENIQFAKQKLANSWNIIN